MPGNAGKRWCSRWVSAERAASRRRVPTASQAQSRVRLASACEGTDPLLEMFEIQVDVADSVLFVDQVGVHQRVAQQHQAVVLADVGRIKAERIEDMVAFAGIECVQVQRGDRAEELARLQWLAR